jgi:hypothetical protein
MYLTIVVVIVTRAEGPSFGGYFDISNKKNISQKNISPKNCGSKRIVWKGIATPVCYILVLAVKLS